MPTDQLTKERPLSPPSRPDGGAGYSIVVPIFNDWQSAGALVGKLDEIAATLGVPVRVFLVDDGSTIPAPRALPCEPKHLARVDLVELFGNLGHQRAIAIGLDVWKTRA